MPLETADDVLQAAGDEEVLLFQPQLLAQIERVVGVEHFAECLCLDLVTDGLGVISLVELLEVELSGRLGGPQAERVDRLGAVADDRSVVCHAEHPLVGNPLVAVAAILLDHLHLATVLDRVDRVRSLDFPRVSVAEPVVRLLDLVAVDDLLAENAVVVADPIAIGGVFQRSQRVHETGG